MAQLLFHGYTLSLKGRYSHSIRCEWKLLISAHRENLNISISVFFNMKRGMNTFHHSNNLIIRTFKFYCLYYRDVKFIPMRLPGMELKFVNNQ